MEARLTRISRTEALRYLGVRGAPEEALCRDLDRCEAQLMSICKPRACWRLFSLMPGGTLAGTSFCPAGKDIRKRILSGNQVIVMAATLGMEAEALIRRTQGQNMADAVLLDVLASAAIENVCDNLCADLAQEMAPRHLTPRFSPGYGDFPLDQQRELFAVLNITRLLGITLTPGGLMVPQKSVTALIGVLEKPCEDASGCADCGLADSCAYRKEEITREHP